jgi:hypothetical protein
MRPKILSFVAKLLGKPVQVDSPVDGEQENELCCEGVVHIAYRGVLDERLYMAYSRRWDEVRFFKPNGLKVFCAECRRRLI